MTWTVRASYHMQRLANSVLMLYFCGQLSGSFEEDTSLPKGLQNWNKDADEGEGGSEDEGKKSAP